MYVLERAKCVFERERGEVSDIERVWVCGSVSVCLGVDVGNADVMSGCTSV